jgi:hypothetical protein
MEIDRSIHYTDAATKRLEQLQADLVKRVEGELRERKFVPGDPFVEITASDIDELARTTRVEFYGRLSQRLDFRQTILKVYAILGSLTLIVGLFFPTLKEMFANRTQMFLILTGAAMTLVSVTLNFAIRSFESSRKSIRDRIHEEELRRGRSGPAV